MNARQEERERKLEADKDWQEYCDSHSIPDIEPPVHTNCRIFGQSLDSLGSVALEFDGWIAHSTDRKAIICFGFNAIKIEELPSFISRFGMKNVLVRVFEGQLAIEGNYA